MSHALHRRTPSLVGSCPRGLPVLTVAYYRVTPVDEATARIERRAFDALGRLADQWDARLWADGGTAMPPNEHTVHGLSDAVLRTASTDAGWRMVLHGAQGEERHGWDGRGTHHWFDYDEQRRLVERHEQLTDAPAACVERFLYGAATETATNRCGRTIRHDDPAGSRAFHGFGLHGQDLAQTQRFLAALDTPDWPESMAARDALLETGGQGAPLSYTTRWLYDGTGTLLNQIDAAGNTQATRYDLAGQPGEVSLKSAGALSAVVVVHTRDYNAFGQRITETAGNGVVSTLAYSAIDGRLQELRAERSGSVLQDLRYDLDPVGNVLRVADEAQPTDWFDGEQVEAVNAYRYDTLYQLVEASGRESMQAGIGPGLPGVVLPGCGDASRRRNYTQTYTYNASGSLLTLSHSGVATRVTHVDARSNRSLPMLQGSPPPEIAAAFDANGNLLRLEGTQAMAWDGRDQLRQVTQVVREDGANDDEVYVYGGGGWRQRKIRRWKAEAVRHVAQVKYLPGLEIRSNTATGEVVHVVAVHTGGTHVRYLAWEQSRKALPTPRWRYAIHDHLGGGVLELDDAGDVVSHEGYYPFGGTAWWAARSETEANDKFFRYADKERDATGLYYYGFRYYAPWLQRWINPDPAGDIDGLNRYAFVGNNPVSSGDVDGRLGSPGSLTPQDDPFFDMEREYMRANQSGQLSPGVLTTNAGHDGSPPLSPLSDDLPLSSSPLSDDLPSTPSQQSGDLLSLSSIIDTLDPLGNYASTSDELLSTLANTLRSSGDILSDAAGLAPNMPTDMPAAGPSRPAKAKPRKRQACTVAGCSWVGIQRALHMTRKHAVAKPYACRSCDLTFDAPYRLKAHQVVHTREKPFRCTAPGCIARYAFQSALNDHIKTGKHKPAQTKKRIPCTYTGCSKSYPYPNNLHDHILSAHKNVRFSCDAPECNHTTTTRSNLITHRKKKHPQ